MIETKSFGSRLFDVFNYVILFLLTVVFLYPMWYVLCASFTSSVG